MKKPFLAVHDYGMGGIWKYIDAPDAEAIARLYPEFTIYPESPDFLSSEDLVRIERELHFDVDVPPTGYLADIVAARSD
jgi:hypothetical protein